MLTSLRFFAPTLGYGGYEVHSREVLRQLVKRGIVVQHKPLRFHTAPVVRDPEMEDVLRTALNTEVPMFSPFLSVCVPDTSFHCIDYRSWGRVPRFNYTTFEADRVPNTWVFCSDAHDCTVVTNNFLKEAWVNSGADERKLEVVGEGINPQVWNKDVKPRELASHNNTSLSTMYKHRFLLMAEFSQRKNVTQAVRCFIKAFAGRKDVCLILKASYLDKTKDANVYLEGLSVKDINLYLFEQILPDVAVPAFMAQATHYFSLSHGEGWDLNCPNMGALGKVVVAPNIMAYRDYLNADRAFLIDKFQWVPAQQDASLQFIFEGARWCGYNDDDVVDVLRKSVESDVVNALMAQKFNEHVMSELTWEQQVNKLVNILNTRCDGIFSDGLGVADAMEGESYELPAAN